MSRQLWMRCREVIGKSGKAGSITWQNDTPWGTFEIVPAPGGGPEYMEIWFSVPEPTPDPETEP